MLLRTVSLLILCLVASSQYSQALGEKLCRLTVASYCKKSLVQNWSCQPCRNSPIKMTNVHTFQNSSMDTLGYIGTSTELDAIVLVFRGTLPWDLKNWISDINFIATEYPLCNNKCKVHRGFYLAYLEINKQIVATVAEYKTKYPHQNLIITGHSLGAALAYHAAGHLMALKYAVNTLYTYGSPRVGDAKYTVWFNDVYGHGRTKARVTHGRDPVPHLPFEEWGFLHVNNQVFYHSKVKDGYTLCKDESGEDKNCSDKNKLDTDVLDHVTYYDIDFTGIVLACQ